MSNLIQRIFSSLILLFFLFFFLNTQGLLFFLLLIIIFVQSTIEWFSLVKNTYLKISGFVFLFLSFYSFYVLKENDLNLLYFVILITAGSDIGGYMFGKILKGPKLISISPNKTYSGSVGSFILSLTFIYFFFEILNLNLFMQKTFDFKYALITIFLSLISQIGDLIISYFKRKSGLKNTGKIIPGHGGLLDRLDGIIFVLIFFHIIFYSNLI